MKKVFNNSNDEKKLAVFNSQGLEVLCTFEQKGEKELKPSISEKKILCTFDDSNKNIKKENEIQTEQNKTVDLYSSQTNAVFNDNFENNEILFDNEKYQNYQFENSEAYNKQNLANQLSQIVEKKTFTKKKSSKKDNLKEGKKTPYKIAEYLLENYYFHNVNSAIYFFDGKKYCHCDKETTKAIILELCRGAVEASGYPSVLENIYKFLVSETKLKSNLYSIPNNIVAFNNGYFDIFNNCFFEPDPCYFITSCLNVDYVQNININTPYFDRYLSDSMQGNTEYINRIWEMLGYILSTDLNGKCFFVLYGKGDSGKSVLGNIIQSFFCSSDISTESLQDLGGRFNMASIVDKRLNISMDLEFDKINTSAIANLKMLTGNDLCRAEAKYSSPFSFKNTAKFLFATNHKIITKIKDEAFINRIVLIPFEHSIPKEKQICNLDEIIVNSEKLAIAIKAFEAYKKLRERNYIFSGGNIGFEEYSDDGFVYDECAILKSYIQNCCIFDEKYKTHSSVLYDEYCRYCNDNNFIAISQDHFCKLLKKEYINKIENKKFRDNNKNCNGFIGISLKKSLEE